MLNTADSAVNTAPITTTRTPEESPRERVPFTRYDAGWVVLCIGMAIGAGIIFLPVQVGLTGIWVFAASVLLAYPALYMMQKLYLQSLSASREADSYANIIAQYLGKNWGIFLAVVYFFMLLKGMLTYSLAVTFDTAKYLQTFGITTGLLSDSPIFSLAILSVLVAIAAQGEKLLFKISGPLVVLKLAIVVFLGVVMVPFWNIGANVPPMPTTSDLEKFAIDTILTVPFTLFSILFVQILSPMNIAFRRVESDPRVATYRAIRANRIAYVILAVLVLFFATSFSFALSHEQALSAKAQNISALALAGAVIPGNGVLYLTTALNVFAVVTAFLGIYLGIEEAVAGLVMNILTRFVPKERINKRVVSLMLCVAIVLGLWLWVQTRFSILLLQQLASPIYGIASFIVPCLLIYKVPALRKYISLKVWYVFVFGLIVCLSPFLKALGY
ncbi:aromatic amino acid transport family protein [Achromobacter marplatensis]|uniref:Amino acid permease n=1 Tax=Achromobacter marplatensis TaxID=470868 RepID=A0AA42WBZ9_9BURK|nr:aromatic amino acid transport family protein [Achromobacter marplatensis]MDH2052365.1 amino acid permease [Achromobacter marplatensis]